MWEKQKTQREQFQVRSQWWATGIISSKKAETSGNWIDFYRLLSLLMSLPYPLFPKGVLVCFYILTNQQLVVSPIQQKRMIDVLWLCLGSWAAAWKPCESPQRPNTSVRNWNLCEPWNLVRVKVIVHTWEISTPERQRWICEMHGNSLGP